MYIHLSWVAVCQTCQGMFKDGNSNNLRFHRWIRLSILCVYMTNENNWHRSPLHQTCSPHCSCRVFCRAALKVRISHQHSVLPHQTSTFLKVVCCDCEQISSLSGSPHSIRKRNGWMAAALLVHLPCLLLKSPQSTHDARRKPQKYCRTKCLRTFLEINIGVSGGVSPYP